MSTTRPFVLLDRDGTLIVERNYLAEPDGVQLIPGAAPALRRLHDLGFGLVLVTNQSGIARGYFTLAQLDAVHRRLADLLAADGAALDAVYVCPHGPDEDCACRKPRPGLVLQAARDLGFDPARAFVIGDKTADVDLARAVGAAAILVRTGYGRTCEADPACRPDHVCDDLPAAADLILRLTAPEQG